MNIRNRWGRTLYYMSDRPDRSNNIREGDEIDIPTIYEFVYCRPHTIFSHSILHEVENIHQNIHLTWTT